MVHYTAMDSAERAEARLCDPKAEVSAHSLIARDGTLTQLVPLCRRAWHAGKGSWRGVTDMNSASIGIELDNDGRSDFAPPLLRSLERHLAQLLTRYDLPPRAVIGHSDYAPARKADPGPRFPWSRLEAQGLAYQAPDPVVAPLNEASFRADLSEIGYDPAAPIQALLDAFRHRYRPGTDGPMAQADAGLARAIVIDQRD